MKERSRIDNNEIENLILPLIRFLLDSPFQTFLPRVKELIEQLRQLILRTRRRPGVIVELIGTTALKSMNTVDVLDDGISISSCLHCGGTFLEEMSGANACVALSRIIEEIGI